MQKQFRNIFQNRRIHERLRSKYYDHYDIEGFKQLSLHVRENNHHQQYLFLRACKK